MEWIQRYLKAAEMEVSRLSIMSIPILNRLNLII